MNKPSINPSIMFFGLAFVIALGIRLAGLGGAFLNDAEATWAVQALKLSQGVHLNIGSQPGLVLFSGALFYIFGSTNFLARLIPALAGAFLVFAPALFTDRLGKTAAFITAFALALDPGLIAMSRQVDGHILSLAFTIFGFGFLNSRKPVAAGIFLGLAFLGGSSVWLGWLGILVTGLIYGLTHPRKKEFEQPLEGENLSTLPSHPGFFRKAFLAFGATVLIAGTLFLLEPKALSGIANSLVAFVTANVGSTPVPANLVIAGLIFYAPLPLVLAIFSTIYAVRRRIEMDGLLIVWAVVAFLLAILYPAHQVADLVWVLVPLWALAARWAARFFEKGITSRLELAQAGLTMVLLVCAWLNFVAAQVNIGQDRTPHWASIVFMIFFLGISLILFTWGWNSRVAFRGFGIGVCLLLSIYMLSTAGRSTGIGPRPEQELWRIGSNFNGADLLLNTVGDFSGWNTGERNTIDIAVTGNSPALLWLFRSFTQVAFVNVLPVDATPSLVITGNQTNLDLPASYSGQSFVADEQPGWATMQFSDWIEWMLFRDVPVTKGLAVLWVKTSEFPGSANFNQKRNN
jgi:hypothetical protein